MRTAHADQRLASRSCTSSSRKDATVQKHELDALTQGCSACCVASRRAPAFAGRGCSPRMGDPWTRSENCSGANLQHWLVDHHADVALMPDKGRTRPVWHQVSHVPSPCATGKRRLDSLSRPEQVWNSTSGLFEQGLFNFFDDDLQSLTLRHYPTRRYSSSCGSVGEPGKAVCNASADVQRLPTCMASTTRIRRMVVETYVMATHRKPK